MIFTKENNKFQIIMILFLSTVAKAFSESNEESLERNNGPHEDSPEAYIVTIENEEKEQGPLSNYFKLSAEIFKKEDEEPLVDSIEYDDSVIIQPTEGRSDEQPLFRAVYYAREFAKKREFLQCKSEEPIVFLCHKSCHNVFKSMCFDFRCPPRLIIQTNTQCYENCRKSYKHLRGQKYIPPDKH